MDDIKAVICPKCKCVISHYQETCPFCSQRLHPLQRVLARRFKLDKINLSQSAIYLSLALFALSYLLPFFLGASGRFGKGMFGLPAPSNIALSFLGWTSLESVLRGEYWRLITAIFLHAGPIHIFFNIVWMRNLSSVTNSLMKPSQIVLVFLFSGFVGNITALFFPVFTSLAFGSPLRNIVVIGFSGAIFGLLGSIIIIGRTKGGLAGVLLAKKTISWGVIIILLGVLIPSISNSANIGGLMTGILLGKLICTPVKVIQTGLNTLFLLTIGSSLLAFLLMFGRLFKILL